MPSMRETATTTVHLKPRAAKLAPKMNQRRNPATPAKVCELFSKHLCSISRIHCEHPLTPQLGHKIRACLNNASLKTSGAKDSGRQ